MAQVAKTCDALVASPDGRGIQLIELSSPGRALSGCGSDRSVARSKNIEHHRTPVSDDICLPVFNSRGKVCALAEQISEGYRPPRPNAWVVPDSKLILCRLTMIWSGHGFKLSAVPLTQPASVCAVAAVQMRPGMGDTRLCQLTPSPRSVAPQLSTGDNEDVRDLLRDGDFVPSDSIVESKRWFRADSIDDVGSMGSRPWTCSGSQRRVRETSMPPRQ